MSERWCCAQAASRGSTAMIASAVQKPNASATRASVRSLARRSSSTGTCGARRSSAPRSASHCHPTPRPACAISPISWQPRSATPRPEPISGRLPVGAQIIVAGRLWGAATVSTSRLEPLPADAEARVCDFADLVATAIDNAHAHAELTASRVRIVAAADHARRRIERDLHDGAQQRLVSLGLELRTVEAGVPADLLPLRARISDLVTTVNGISEDLQELSRGIHPAILSKGGLGPAIKVLARRSAIPVELLLGMHRRLPDPVEVAAYYVVPEALTNAAKHARASMVEVCADTEGQDLHLSIRDDGIGGADAAKGSGVTGLCDRVEALSGTLSISSHPGIGTELRARIPFVAPPNPDGSIE